jgi:pyruvate kinase
LKPVLMYVDSIFSHGAYEDHQKVIDNINQYNAYFKSHVGKLLDLQGPKLRIGTVENDGIELIKGRKLIVTTHSEVSTAERLSVNYEKLAAEVKTGEKIQLDDGKLELKVLRSDGKSEIECQVITGGRLTSRKGFNLPQTKTTLPCLTEDRADLEFGLENNVDWVGLSFVRQAADILEVKTSSDKKANTHGLWPKLKNRKP